MCYYTSHLFVLLWILTQGLHFTHEAPADSMQLKERVKAMFYHAYNGYMQFAYPFDELRPLTCDGHDTWGSFALTLVDSLDTLAIMGNWSEFRRASQMLLDHLDANRNVNVSVFETNIRVVGGLLSAHILSRRADFQVEPTWPCSGPLLRQAELFASKLLPAFDTSTGMPYGTVNLASNSVPPNETTVTCVAGIGTFIIEFGTLSRLTGDPRFEQAAVRALRSLWNHRSSIGLLGNHIDINSGKWVALESTIGGSVDSLFEYLVKGSALFQLPELDAMFREYKESINSYLLHGDWHFVAHKDSGQITRPIFQGLDAFWPSILSLTGDLDGAMKHIMAYHGIWKQYGFIPETYNVVLREASGTQRSYHLRPEFIESVYYLYKATKDPIYLQIGQDVLASIEQVTRTECGFATVMDVTTHKLDNRMESFFLSETTKYLYLLFDEDNFINKLPGDHPLPSIFDAHLSSSGNTCLPEMGGYIFNTEAHPISPGVLNCCYMKNLETLYPQTSPSSPVGSMTLDLEQIERLEDDVQPMKDLLSVIDAVFDDHLLIPDHGTNDLGKDPFDSPNLPHLLEPWTNLRKIVVDGMSDIFPHDMNPSESFTTENPVIYNLNQIRPTLLSCPYPPFHQRYLYAGQVIS